MTRDELLARYRKAAKDCEKQCSRHMKIAARSQKRSLWVKSQKHITLSAQYDAMVTAWELAAAWLQDSGIGEQPPPSSREPGVGDSVFVEYDSGSMSSTGISALELVEAENSSDA